MSDTETQPIVPASLLSVEKTLPDDWQQACLVGRVMLPGVGPAVVTVRPDGNVVDITGIYPTTRDLTEMEDPAAAARQAALRGKVIGRVEDILANSSVRDASKPYMLAPNDFHEVLAAGVTFVESMVERMVEEAAMKEVPTGADGQLDQQKLGEVRERIRAEVAGIVGDTDFSKVVPGSPGALRILERMKELGMSTIYPQVGLGREGEVFAKAAPVTAVGHGAQAGYGVPRDGEPLWVNPEPEVVLFANSKGKIVGAAHGNDVNDRGKEGRSALLLHRAKVQNGSAAVGPFVRLFDKDFTLESIRDTEVKLEVTRTDGSLKYEGANKMGKISRKPEEIVAAAMDPERHHPDGIAIFLGTMIVPEKMKMPGGAKDEIFTHEPGDVVRMGSPQLGYLTNVMVPADRVQGLEQGALDLARNLAGRGLLTGMGAVRPARVMSGRC